MKKYLYIALAAAALTSCSSDEAIEMVEKRAIGFDNVFVNNATRATDLNKDNITEFGVYASVSANNTQGMILSNERVYKPEGKTEFGYDNTQYWIASAQYDFTAIAPYQTGTNATWSYSTTDAKNGTVEFDNETAQADQDLLFAYIQPESKHPIKYTIPNITKAAIPIVGYAAFAIYSHSFFHLCGSICSSSSFVAFCIYGILAITSFR